MISEIINKIFNKIFNSDYTFNEKNFKFKKKYHNNDEDRKSFIYNKNKINKG